MIGFLRNVNKLNKEELENEIRSWRGTTRSEVIDETIHTLKTFGELPEDDESFSNELSKMKDNRLYAIADVVFELSLK